MAVSKFKKYIVLKIEDCDKFLTAYEQNELSLICEKITLERMRLNKKQNSYLVVNEDEPYAKMVWHLIEDNQSSPVSP